MEQKRAGGKTLAADAYAAIRQTIRSGSFKPGDRLRFADLQALCGMSVTPVREALARLTTHWRLPFGAAVVLAVLFTRGGLLGALRGRR